MNIVNNNKRVIDLTDDIDKGNKRQCHENDEELARQLQQNELSKELMSPPKIKASCNCSITITWIEVPYVKGYYVRYKEKSSNEWIVIKQIISGTIVKKNNLNTKTPYVFCVKPLFDIMEGNWSLTSLPMYTSKPLTIATFNIGRSGLPSFFTNIQTHQKQYSNTTASDMVAELMNKHELDVLCLQELKGNVKEWKQFREGLQNSKSNQIIGITQDTMLLNLKNMTDFDFIVASDNKNKGMNGNVGMIIRKSLEVSEDQVSHCLQGFNDERTINTIDNETNKYRKSNDGRYLEVALGCSTVLINIYVHACASENQEVAQKQYQYRTNFLSAVEERINQLKTNQKKSVICVGDFNGTEVLTLLTDCANLPIHRYTYYNQTINEKDEVVKAEKKSWHEVHWKGKKVLWDGAYNRHNPSFGRGGFPCDYIKSTSDIEILSPCFKSPNLRMYGCNLSCSIPCHNPEHALAASVNSCNVKFPFDTAALIVYTSLDSDHMILKVNFNVSGI